MPAIAKKTKKYIIAAAVLFAAFILFTVLVKTVDVKPIGPEGSSVGFAAINLAVFESTGYNPYWKKLSSLLGYAVFAVAGAFVVLMLVQAIKRKSLKKVDPDLYVLLGLYVIIAIVYGIFELVKLNYRPVILDEGLEASYPSSHTLFALGIMIPAILQMTKRFKDMRIVVLLDFLAAAVAYMTVMSRLFAGVHWLTDIIGGVLISVALVMAYVAVASIFTKNTPPQGPAETAKTE